MYFVIYVLFSLGIVLVRYVFSSFVIPLVISFFSYFIS